LYSFDGCVVVKLTQRDRRHGKDKINNHELKSGYASRQKIGHTEKIKCNNHETKKLL
jgi:hypothetical protein